MSWPGLGILAAGPGPGDIGPCAAVRGGVHRGGGGEREGGVNLGDRGPDAGGVLFLALAEVLVCLRGELPGAAVVLRPGRGRALFVADMSFWLLCRAAARSYSVTANME